MTPIPSPYLQLKFSLKKTTSVDAWCPLVGGGGGGGGGNCLFANTQVNKISVNTCIFDVKKFVNWTKCQ